MSISWSRSAPFLLILLLLSLMIIACEKQSDPSYEALTFNVDPNLLGTTFIDSIQNIAFQPPANWNPVSAEMMKVIEKQLDLKIGNSMIYQLSPLQIFFCPRYQSFCSVSLVDSNKLDFEEYATLLKQEIVRALPETRITDGFFKIGTLPCYQLVLLDKERVNLKLIFTGARNLMQVDYVVIRQNYAESIKSIESSIGSLKDLNN